MRRIKCFGFLLGLGLLMLGAALGWSHSTSAQTASGNSAVEVVAGHSHSCALTDQGSVMCWGFNLSGELGDGTNRNRDIVVDVVGLDDEIVSLTAGLSHTCALTAKGGAICWGDNGQGQLGAEPGGRCGESDPSSCSSIPVSVVGLESGVEAISAGLFHTCAVVEAGMVKCWGGNSSGELGLGIDDFNRPIPEDVVGLTEPVQALAAGDGHTCVLAVSGGVKCWGRGDRGALGDAQSCGRRCATPVDVQGLQAGVREIVAGDWHTCALTEAGAVYCWGYNQFGQLGDGTNEQRDTPVQVVDLTEHVVSLTASGAKTCALFEEGPPRCWGMNTRGSLGDGTVTERRRPVDLTVVTETVIYLAVSGEHSCAVVQGGAVKCWGNSYSGALGNGEGGRLVALLEPVNVIGFGGDDSTAAEQDVEASEDAASETSGGGGSFLTTPLVALAVLGGVGAAAVGVWFLRRHPKARPVEPPQD